jgi:hypothetical protein
MHLMRKRYTGMAATGLFRMPTPLHTTYCGLRDITTHEIDTLEKNIDCDECIQAKAWEDIDAISAQ